MSHAELKSMAAAGFVDPKDLMYNKTGDIKGIKPGAHMYKSDLFGSDIATWSWQFHSDYLKRKGATEGGFNDLIARMPRNMNALVAFLVANEARIKRDAQTREGAIGSAAAGNAFLAANPMAGLDALKASIEAFAGVVSEPAMKAVGQNLEKLAADLQKLASFYGQFAHDHPDAAGKLGVAAGGGALGAAGWLSWKMLTGMGRFFGFGGGSGGAAGGAAGGAGAGMMSRLGWLGAIIGLTEWFDPQGNFGGATSGVDKWVKQHFGFDPSNVPLHMPSFAPSAGGGGQVQPWYRDFQNRGGAFGSPAPVEVHGQATVNVPVAVTVTASPELFRLVEDAKQAVRTATAQVPLNPVATGHTGRMDSDAAPLGGHWVWDR